MPQGGTPAPKMSLEHLNLKQKGDDLSMLERLDILRTGRRESKPTTPRTPPEKPSELRRRKSATREGSKKTESESGAPPSKSKTEVSKETSHEEQRVMVRAGGFQWIDRQAKGDVLSQTTEELQQTPVTETSRASLRNNSTTRRSQGRDSPSRAGSRKGYTPSQTPRQDQQ